MKNTGTIEIRLMETFTNDDSFNSTGSHDCHSGHSGSMDIDSSPLGFIKVTFRLKNSQFIHFIQCLTRMRKRKFHVQIIKKDTVSKSTEVAKQDVKIYL